MQETVRLAAADHPYTASSAARKEASGRKAALRPQRAFRLALSDQQRSQIISAMRRPCPPWVAPGLVVAALAFLAPFTYGTTRRPLLGPSARLTAARVCCSFSKSTWGGPVRPRVGIHIANAG